MNVLYLSILFSTLVLGLPLTLFPQQSSLEAETDRLLFSTTMAEFQIARGSQTPSELDWTSNGCSFSPEEPLGFDFEPSCQRHDFGYRNYKAQGRFTDAGKGSVDDNFKRDMDDQCATEGILEDLCGGVADVYYQAVVNFGSRVKRVDHLRDDKSSV